MVKIIHSDNALERLVLTSMITSDQVISTIEPKWTREGLFRSKWANEVGKVCVNYQRKYGKSIGKKIERWFIVWSEKTKDQSSLDEINKFLGSLFNDYDRTEETNHALLIDTAAKFFNDERLAKTVEEAQYEIDRGNSDKAQELIEGHSKISMGEDAWSDFLDDKEIDDSFDEKEEKPLIEFDGPLQSLGEFFSFSLAREEFIAILAPEKSGKSWIMIDLAIRAMMQRRRVAFFEVGDMTKRQVKNRFLISMSGIPKRNPTGKWPYTTKIPVKITKPQKGSGKCYAEIEQEELIINSALTREQAKKSRDDVVRNKIKSKKSYFRLVSRPTDTVTVAEIKSIVQGWKISGWEADIVFIDYADLLASPISSRKQDTRDQINATWKQLSTLRQDLHCLVITATQADAKSYEKETIDRRNFSEDKRKLSHVTGLIGINMTGPEKAKNGFRLNWVLARELPFPSTKHLHVAGCLDIGKPMILSSW